MAGPLMNRLDQFLAAPNQTYLEDYNEFITYVEGIAEYPLARVASRLKAIVLSTSIPSQVYFKTSTSVTLELTGNSAFYLVRMYQDPGTGEYLEEALIPSTEYSIEFVQDLLDSNTGLITKRFQLNWAVPPDPFSYPEPEGYLGPWPPAPLDWAYPLGTPAAYIPRKQLPVPQRPLGVNSEAVPYNPVVLSGNPFRVYTTGMANIQNLSQAKIKTIKVDGLDSSSLDMATVQPAPEAGPMMVYYQVPEGNLLSK
jgi:hypothetical protein